VGDDGGRVAAFLTRCIPPGAPFGYGPDEPFTVDTLQMLLDIESGREEARRFRLSLLVPQPLRRILLVAAAIPRGQVTSYGDIAAAAGTEARVVGQAMATNRLYPIVPCHRVVGADMALVGYGRRQDEAALLAKLNRLRAEARGCEQCVITAAGRSLRVYPAERVIARAARDGAGAVQLSLFE
jgi:methylated-DNA-[protein]-cysteine S-methyltransferase